MGIHHCYEQSSAAWHREWSDDCSEMEEMTQEEREEAENEAKAEIERAIDEEAWIRNQEQEQINPSPCFAESEFDLDAAF